MKIKVATWQFWEFWELQGRIFEFLAFRIDESFEVICVSWGLCVADYRGPKTKSQVELTMSWRLKESQFLRHPPILYVCIYIYICTIHTPNYTYIIHSYFIFLYKSWLSFLQRFLTTSDCEVLWHCQQNLSWLLFQKHAATISKRSHPTIYQDGTRSVGTEGP